MTPHGTVRLCRFSPFFSFFIIQYKNNFTSTNYTNVLIPPSSTWAHSYLTHTRVPISTSSTQAHSYLTHSRVLISTSSTRTHSYLTHSRVLIPTSSTHATPYLTNRYVLIPMSWTHANYYSYLTHSGVLNPVSSTHAYSYLHWYICLCKTNTCFSIFNLHWHKEQIHIHHYHTLIYSVSKKHIHIQH